MKTSEFIKLLQKEDPNDECVICVNNHPVTWIDRQPYYYDGRLEYIERDSHNNPVKVGYKAGGQKIKIFYDTVEDALLDNPNAELELSGITYNDQVNEHYMKPIEHWIKEGLEFQEWKRNFDEARSRGEDYPLLVSKLNWKQKLGNWLQKIGLIEK